MSSDRLSAEWHALFDRQTHDPPAIVVDSSVVLAAMRSVETHHLVSVQFLAECSAVGCEIWCPATILWEIGSTLDHPAKTPDGTEWNKTFAFNFRFLPVDEELFKRTWRAPRAPVKAADRLFLATAWALRAPLTTWDTNLAGQAHLFDVVARSPAELLELLLPSS